MRVGIATDHGGFALKEELATYLREAGHEVIDFGAHSLNPGDDYPDFVIPLAWRSLPGRWNEAWLSAAAASAPQYAPIRSWGSGPGWFRTTTRLTKEWSTTI
jgi:hypothetical protein